MSLGLDIIPELEIDEQVRYMKVEEDAKKGYWLTKDGRILHVSQMSEKHIRNTIKYIERVDKTDLYLPWINRFKRELKERGLDG